MPKYNVVRVLNLAKKEIGMQFELDTDVNTIEASYDKEIAIALPCSLTAKHNEAVFCVDESNNKITLLNCNYIFAPTLTMLLTYNGVIIGAHIADLNILAITRFTAYLKNTIVRQPLCSKQKIKLYNALELYTNRDKAKVDETTYFLGDILSIESLTYIQYKTLKSTFDSVRELIYLCVGYFDYIDRIEIFAEACGRLTYYNASESIYSHANEHNFGYLYLAQLKDIEYKNALPLWDEIKSIGMYGELDGAFFHYFIAAQNKSIPVEIRLCMLIQSIDGFINKRYLHKFVGNDILIYKLENGTEIKSVKLKPAIKHFLKLTPYGGIIFKKEIGTLTLNRLISHLISTRNLFSHVGDQQNVFREKAARIIYTKMLLLWRMVLLDSVKIPVSTTQVDKIVEEIEASRV